MLLVWGGKKHYNYSTYLIKFTLFAGVNHSLIYNYNYGVLKTFEMGLKL